MILTLYTNTDDPKTLVKTHSAQLGTAQALAPTGQVNVINPVVSIDYDAAFLSANYCYIDTFNRYYYCTVGLDTAMRMIISCKVDYLTSFASYIGQCPATIVRAELEGPTYMVDDKLPIDPSRVDIIPYNFEGDPLYVPDSDHYKYLLITNGGGESSGD